MGKQCNHLRLINMHLVEQFKLSNQMPVSTASCRLHQQCRATSFGIKHEGDYFGQAD
jgi:hypothetical protein